MNKNSYLYKIADKFNLIDHSGDSVEASISFKKAMERPSVETNEDRCNKLIKSINKSIKSCVNAGETFYVRELYRDQVEFEDEVLKHYIDLGYIAVMMDRVMPNAEFSNKLANLPILFISWNENIKD